MALYCRPSDIITDGGSGFAWQAGVADPNYPIANAKDRLSHTVAKVTGTTGTIRTTFASAKTLQAVAVINTNATAIQLTNGAGLNQAISIPSTPEDGLRLDPWIDLRSLGLTSSTQWDLAFTAGTAVAVGEVLLVQTLRTLRILWDETPEEHQSHGIRKYETEYGVKLKHGMGVRTRAVEGTALRDTLRDDILSLSRDASGELENFLLILDSDLNDAMYVDLETDVLRILRVAPCIAQCKLRFREQQKGII